MYTLFEQVIRQNRYNILGIASTLAPMGKVEGHEYIALNPRRVDHDLGSFKINTLSGKWCEFATGEGGDDIISYCAYVQGITQYEAAKEVSQITELPVMKSQSYGLPSKEPRVDNSNAARKIWHECKAPTGSVVER